MKTLATLFLLAISFTAVAQQYLFHEEVHDDGKRLKIKVDIEEKGRSIHYSNTFNVSGMSKEEKEDLVARTLESVKGRKTQEELSTAYAPRPARSATRIASATCPEARSTVAHRDAPATWTTASAEATASANPVMEKHSPFQKSIEEDIEAKRIKVRYEYFENGEEHIFERTINTEGRTEREIKKLLEETEKSLGLTQKSM
ncbi:hypothetical protein [Telluribacter sp. SYSU D00476]|uniref:hypothetical protein n=1 Tax=Telluribacter sp. SYSU D00476 TaxID=2811430 RepID=UPI001FF15DEA|nr:hypothetical protein [Telluribacter sp. SYSU D00476]